jgi:periplasmic protein TonB
MRLTFSMLAALLCHAAIFGVAATVLSHLATAKVVPLPETLEIELVAVAAKPDPIADAAPSSSPPSASNPAPAPPRRRGVSHRQEVALVSEPVTSVSPAGTEAPVQVTPVPAATASTTSLVVAPAPAATRPPESNGNVVTAKPRYRSNPKPDYPLTSRRRGEEGVVLLKVAVEVNGTPSAIVLSKSSGHPLLDHAALDAVHRWTFEPERRGGLPMRSVVEVPVRFSLTEGVQ